MLSIKNWSMLMKSVSENFFVESEWVFCLLQNKICPFLYIALRWLFLFMKTVGPTPVVCSCVEGREIKCFNAIAGG